MAFLPFALLAAARFQRATNYWYSLPRAALATLAGPGLPCPAPSVRIPEPIRDGLILAASREGEDAGLNDLRTRSEYRPRTRILCLLAATRFQPATNYWYSLPRAALATLAYPELPCPAPSVRIPEPIRDGLILAASREGEDAGLNGLRATAGVGVPTPDTNLVPAGCRTLSACNELLVFLTQGCARLPWATLPGTFGAKSRGGGRRHSRFFFLIGD